MKQKLIFAVVILLFARAAEAGPVWESSLAGWHTVMAQMLETDGRVVMLIAAPSATRQIRFEFSPILKTTTNLMQTKTLPRLCADPLDCAIRSSGASARLWVLR